MKSLKKSQYSLRKTLIKDRQPPSLKKSNISSKTMSRTVKDDRLKTGVKRTRGRPRTKDIKISQAAKRHKHSSVLSANGTKSPQRESSVSPNRQDPPQLEPMPAVDPDDELDIPLSFSLMSTDDHLCTGKCLVICTVHNCRKRFSDPIELVSHLRINHEEETFSSIKIYSCPICLKTRLSKHTTSSDLTLLSEHAERYHGKTLKQSDFIYFCTVVLDVATGDKATQKREENNVVTKEEACMIQHSNQDGSYHAILPLVSYSTTNSPASTTTEIPIESGACKAASANTDSSGLKASAAKAGGHFIQLSPMAQRLTSATVSGGLNSNSSPAAVPTVTATCSAPQQQQVFATLAAVAGQLSTGIAPTTLLLPTTTVTTSTASDQSIFLAPSTPNKSFPLLISTSAPAVHSEMTHMNPLVAPLLQPQSPKSAAAIETLNQLIQSVSGLSKLQQQHSVAQTLLASSSPAGASLNSSTGTTTGAFMSPLSSIQSAANSASPNKVAKVEQPPASASVSLSTSNPVTYSFIPGAPVVASPSAAGVEFDYNADLNSFASANADLLTLARLSVNQATAEASNNNNNNNNNNSSTNSVSLHEATHTAATHTILPQQATALSSPTPRNRRLLPRKTAPSIHPGSPIPVSSSSTLPIALRKRVPLPPLAVKPPKDFASPTTTTIESVSDEAPVMAAALINTPATVSNASATLLSSNLSSMLAKSRLLQASTSATASAALPVSKPPSPVAVTSPTTVATATPAFITVQPRPPQVLGTLVPSSNTAQSQQHVIQHHHAHVIQPRPQPTIRPTQLQKILPRPNTHTVSATGKELRPLLYSVTPVPPSHAATLPVQTQSSVTLATTPGVATILTSAPTQPVAASSSTTASSNLIAISAPAVTPVPPSVNGNGNGTLVTTALAVTATATSAGSASTAAPPPPPPPAPAPAPPLPVTTSSASPNTSGAAEDAGGSRLVICTSP